MIIMLAQSALRFDDLRWLHLTWIALLCVVLGAVAVWRRRVALRRFADAATRRRIAPREQSLRQALRVGLVGAALVLLVAAAVGPRWGEREQRVMRRGIDVMILLDVSRSMLARDISPNRLERAKLSISDDLLPTLAGDRVGLIAFAGSATLACPLTNDYGFFRLALEDITPRSAARGGTLIGDAIRKAADAMDQSLDNYRVILLITDGEDQDSYPVEAARALWTDRKIPIVPIALGDEREGARIPLADGSSRAYLEYKGEEVWSKADFSQLRQIAAASELDKFVPVGTRNFDLGEIYRNAIVPYITFKEREEQERIPLPAQFHWFAGAALALLLIDTLLREGPGPAAVAVRRFGLRRSA